MTNIGEHARDLRDIAESLSSASMEIGWLRDALRQLAEVHAEDHDELGELARRVLSKLAG